MNKFKKITVDISNICNAKCKWCTTGIKNRASMSEARFMTAEEFEKVLNYCLGNQIIDSNADVELYSWGEPFLNPDILKIVDIIIAKNMEFNLSTNGSKVIEFKEEQIKKIKFLMFSLSGFSQATYGKIHGLNLETILGNIRKMVEPFKKCGMLEKVEINFHVYQFNLGELKACSEFCRKLGIRFVPRYAFIADWKLCNDYLRNDMEKDIQKEASKDLFFHYYDRMIGEMPEKYHCPQEERLFINSCGEVIPCAYATGDALGNIFEMTYQNIAIGKKEYNRCKSCLKTGQAYVIHQYTEFLSEYDEEVGEGIRYYGETLTPALYYSVDEKGFSEERKYTISCTLRKNGNFVARFHIADEIVVRQIRFDPCEYSCTLSKLIILCDGRKMEFYPYDAIYNSEHEIIFQTNDPCVIVDVNAEVKEIEIRGIIG